MPWRLHIMQKLALVKKGRPVFLLLGTWSLVLYPHVWLKLNFSNNSNQAIFVDVQRLHKNGKWIICVSNGVYTLF